MKMDFVFVPVAIAKKIAAIEPRARRLGWPLALLLDSNLDDYGRPARLSDPRDVIVAVERTHIMIRKNRLHVLRFPRS
jgi:hypothetical protein